MLINLKIPKDLRRKIDNELQSGEFIKWVEQPAPRFFTDASITCLLFGIFFIGFGMLWMLSVLGFELPDLKEGVQPQHLYVLLVCVPFALLGLGMLFYPIQIWQAERKTVYLVTNKRAIIVQADQDGRSTIIRSYLPNQLKDIYRKERVDGTGDVIIIAIWQCRVRDVDSYQNEEIGFLRVRSPRDVENMLRQLGSE